MSRALILGVGGQDGSYLADILLEKGYEVHGLIRRSSVDNTVRIKHVLDRIVLHQGDLADYGSLHHAIVASNPDEIYNEADQDAVGWSRHVPSYNYDVTFKAAGNLLEIMRHEAPEARLFQPVSATMFQGAEYPQDEDTPLTPKSPYACAKAGAYLLSRYYREVHGMFVSTGILYNHDSPRRGEDYLVHKICKSAIRVAEGKQDKIRLGNLDHLVDIGHAREYMEAAWSILQLDKPDDYVIATGISYSVGALAYSALGQLGITDTHSLVEVDPSFVPKIGRTEPPLIGDIEKARTAFGFNPTLHGFMLINSILEELR